MTARPQKSGSTRSPGAFRKAVEETAPLEGHLKKGLQALQAAHRAQIKCRDARSVVGSVNLDDALKSSHPNEPRWDHAIGLWSSKHHGEAVAWVEVHPAPSTHIDEVLEKLEWLREWLKGEGMKLANMPRAGFYWLASGGRVAITPHSLQARKIAAKGLLGPARILHL